MNRLLGIEEGGAKDTLMILVGGLHGNESTGVSAIINVFRSIQENNIPVNGKIIGLIGNVIAFEMGKRFIDYDLNRCWTEELAHELRFNHNPMEEKAEDSEFLELLGEIEKYSKGNYRKKILVDLHATSSENGNFIVIPMDEADNEIVNALSLPIVVDLEKYLAGTLLEYMHKRNFISFAFEGGLIGSDKALSLHTSGIWELLFASGMVERRYHDEFIKYSGIVESFIHNLPHKVSILYRHEVNESDDFKMKPGYHNFQKVKKGEVVARDNKGKIKAKEDGLIFMPLYQLKGKDGFFIVKELESNI